jgi:hypothetical protein
MTSEMDMSEEEATGMVGVLTVATRGRLGPGEVRIRIRGGSEQFLAWSDGPLPRGATVLVTDVRGARAVGVVEWEDPLGDAPNLHGPAQNQRSGE